MTDDYHMWKFWRDDKGFEVALTEYFSDTIKNDPEIHRLYNQYKDAKDLINLRMATLAGDFEDWED